MAIKRREFLKSGTMLAGAFTLAFVLPEPLRSGSKQAAPGEFIPNAFIRISADNLITILIGKSEMGQNVYTGLPMILAEELDADWNSIRIEQAGVDAAFNSPWLPMMFTGGSSSIRTSYETLRQAGATARAMLLNAAASQWRVPADRLITENSRVTDPVTGSNSSYGDLAATASSQPVPESVSLKSPDRFRLLGRDRKRLDSVIKVRGEAEFGMDVSLPGMHYAVVVRPPVFGARLDSYDKSEAINMPGVVQVKEIPSGVAVIADSSWRAIRARQALKVRWMEGAFKNQNSEKMWQEYRALADRPGFIVKQIGDVGRGSGEAAHVIEATYEVPFLAHACMEPLNCTVHDQRGKAEIWTGTQMQTEDRRRAADVLGYAPEAIDLHTMFLGGGFGRRAAAGSDFVVEAAHVARGEPWPVKTLWTREDDTRGGAYRPMTLHKSRLTLGRDGRPSSWHNRVVGQGLDGLDTFGMGGTDFDRTQVEGLVDPVYPVPNYQLEAHLLDSPVTTLWWRSVGHTHTAFLQECLFDEAAHAVGADPLEYRLDLLAGHPRHQALLQKVGAMAGWAKGMPAGTGLGVAIAESFGSIVAEVAQVKVAEGNIHVEKVWCVVDCGFAINPLGVREQMESAINFGLSAALFGEVTFADGKVQQSNFHDYRVVRMNQSPVIDVAIINSGANMGGVGEPGTPPIFPAVGNAIFAASGKRLRAMPFQGQL